MKKIVAIVVIGLFLLMSVNIIGGKVITSKVEKEDYTIFDDDFHDVRAFFIFRGPIINKLFSQIDMLSFSLYEDAETPEFLYMKMNIGGVKYTELRSLYNIIWNFAGLMYCTGMHTLNSSETILDYSAFYESDGTEHKIWNTYVEIDEVNSVFTWTITKNDLDLKAGDVLEKPWAQSNFGTKDWETYKSFAIDKIPSGPDYVIQYLNKVKHMKKYWINKSFKGMNKIYAYHPRQDRLPTLQKSISRRP